MLALWLVLGAPAVLGQSPAPSPAASPTPTIFPSWAQWKEQGFLPYHQLTVDDFRVQEVAKGRDDYYVQAFIEPRYEGFLHYNRGWVHAYIKTWRVFSGFNQTASYRRKGFRGMRDEMPIAQAILDLSEIRARELAIMPPDGWPEFRGGAKEEVMAGLEARVHALCQAKYDAAQADIDAFLKATDQGQDKKKVAKMAAEIRKRLEAMPKAAEPGPVPSATPSPTPAAKVG